MAGFDDLIEDAMPYMVVESIDATQGATWRWGYVVKDTAGDLVDMTSGFTATLRIVNRRVSPVVTISTVTPTFPASGQILCEVSATASAALATGNYQHELYVTRTSDSRVVCLLGAGASTFRIKADLT